ncbi:MAG: diaminopimelate decarboxylase [Clostridia bacterium]|nr:diaminopimelate decarboxylase [Clostridia bacterium]
MENNLICENLSIDSKNQLNIAGVNTVELAEKYGTPLFVIDEKRVREKCKTYISAVKKFFKEGSGVLYASKALSCKRIYEIMKEEGMGIDVVSQGEIFTAKKAGFPLDKAYFHSNNKTDDDIDYAIKCGVGTFVVDNVEELVVIDEIARKNHKKQNVLLRLTPGIDPHTYDAISTGKVDSKFGSPIETGQAEEITKIALNLKNVCLKGFHCHVGSQVFDSDVYLKASKVMLSFIAEMNKKLGYSAEILDLGGGYGVRYIEDQPIIDVYENIKLVGEYIKSLVSSLNIEMPKIFFEPGRSIVADSGLTLYTVGTVKRIPGYKNYVSVDGGMTDNPRFALYKADYTVVPAYDMLKKRDMTASIVGRCCESGDIIQENVNMPSTIKRGDIIACLTTGAYNYSMSSNYNRIARPPIVMINNKKDYVAVKRETLENIVGLDI